MDGVVFLKNVGKYCLEIVYIIEVANKCVPSVQKKFKVHILDTNLPF
jgi:hypothetical protein